MNQELILCRIEVEQQHLTLVAGEQHDVVDIDIERKRRHLKQSPLAPAQNDRLVALPFEARNHSGEDLGEGLSELIDLIYRNFVGLEVVGNSCCCRFISDHLARWTRLWKLGGNQLLGKWLESIWRLEADATIIEGQRFRTGHRHHKGETHTANKRTLHRQSPPEFQADPVFARVQPEAFDFNPGLNALKESQD